MRGPKGLAQESLDHAGLHGVPAAEHIDRSATVLGPGMDRDVGLGDDDHPAYAVGIEAVEDVRDDRGARAAGGLEHRFADARGVVEALGRTAVVLDEDMRA
jgi:hypothetical protein